MLILCPDPPKINPELKNESVTYNTSLQFICSLSGFPTPEILWTKDGENLGNNNTLTINRVSYGDTGQYTCSANNSGGNSEVAFHITVTGKRWHTFVSFSCSSHFLGSFFLFLYTFTFFDLYFWILCPGPPEINPELKNRSVTYRSPLQFNCSLSGFPTPEILWTKDGENLGNNNTLTINRVSYGDTGQYTCSANNSGGNSEVAFHITVTGKRWHTFVSFSCSSHFLGSFFLFLYTFTFFDLYFWILCPGPPEINPELKNRSVTYRSPLQFNCSLSGFPTPEILWTKDGENLGNNNTLTINRVSYGDAGQYTCSANNSGGSSEGAFHIIVTGKRWLNFGSFSCSSHFLGVFSFFSYFPLFELYFEILCPGPPEINTELKNQSVTYKTSLQFNCSLSGFPTPEILWTKDGENIGNKNTLTINRVSYGDAGQYTCSAKNSEGKNEAAFHITVTGKCWHTLFPLVALLVFCCSFQTFPFFELCLLILCPGPPEINPELKNQSVTYKTSLQFNCSLSGFPTPEILWTKDGENLGNNNTLTINPVSYGDAGQYACSANNSEGNNEAAFDITVTGKRWHTFVSFNCSSYFLRFFFLFFFFFILSPFLICTFEFYAQVGLKLILSSRIGQLHINHRFSSIAL